MQTVDAHQDQNGIVCNESLFVIQYVLTRFTICPNLFFLKPAERFPTFYCRVHFAKIEIKYRARLVLFFRPPLTVAQLSEM